MNIYPLSDDYMIYDKTTSKYVLTEKYVSDQLGINLVARSKNEAAIKRVLKLASNQVYRFIHDHNINNNLQDYIIAKTESGRKIIMEAMAEQLTYLTFGGDVSRVHDWEKRSMYLDDNAKSVLYQTIPEIGTTICYTGRFVTNFNIGEENV